MGGTRLLGVTAAPEVWRIPKRERCDYFQTQCQLMRTPNRIARVNNRGLLRRSRSRWYRSAPLSRRNHNPARKLQSSCRHWHDGPHRALLVRLPPRCHCCPHYNDTAQDQCSCSRHAATAHPAERELHPGRSALVDSATILGTAADGILHASSSRATRGSVVDAASAYCKPSRRHHRAFAGPRRDIGEGTMRCLLTPR